MLHNTRRPVVRAIARVRRDTIIDPRPMGARMRHVATPRKVRVSTFATATLRIGRWTFTTRHPALVTCLWLMARVAKVVGVIR